MHLALAPLIALLPAVLANPIPTPQDAPQSAPGVATATATGSGAAASVIVRSSVAAGVSSVISRPATASGGGSASRSAGGVVVSRSAAAPRPTGPYGLIPFGVYYEDPDNGTRIHPRGRRDLCVIVANETVTEGAVLEVGRCLNNTLPYPGKRNLFNLTLPFDIVPLNETNTVGVNRTGNGTSAPSSVVASGSITPATVQYITPASAASVSGAAVSSGVAVGSGVATSARPAQSSVYRPTATASGARPTSTNGVPLPEEIGLYEGLIAPEGQDEYCLSGDIFDPYAEDDDDETTSSSSASGIAARQLETQTLVPTPSVSRSPAAQSSVRTAVGSGVSRAVTASRSAAAPPSASASASGRPGRVRGPQDGLITLQKCNASDPAQWWRFGADVRVTIPGEAPGQGWKLSLRNQTQCATILGTGPESRDPRRVFKMYPCVSNGESQLLYVVNNGTTASGARDNATTTTTTTAVSSSVSVSVSGSASASSASVPVSA